MLKNLDRSHFDEDGGVGEVSRRDMVCLRNKM